MSEDISKSCIFNSLGLDSIEETAKIAIIKVSCLRNTIGYFFSDLKTRLLKEGYVNVSVQDASCRPNHMNSITTIMRVDFTLIVEAYVGNEKCMLHLIGPQLLASCSRTKKPYHAHVMWLWNERYQNVQLDGRSVCYDTQEGRDLAKTLKPMKYDLSLPKDYEDNMTRVLILIRNYFESVAVHGMKDATDDEHIKDYAKRCRLQIENADRKDEIRSSGKKFY